MKSIKKSVFSESYMKAKVTLIEEGKITAQELAGSLGMKNTKTIDTWIKKYGKKNE